MCGLCQSATEVENHRFKAEIQVRTVGGGVCVFNNELCMFLLWCNTWRTKYEEVEEGP